MDINSLLSPQDSSARGPPQQQQQQQPQPQPQPPSGTIPKKRPGRPAPTKRTPSTLSHEIIRSPSHETPPRSVPHLGYDQVAQAQAAFQPHYNGHLNVTTPGSQFSVVSPFVEQMSPFGTPQQQRPSLSHMVHRHSSTPQMETLADLASMQQHQQPRQNSVTNLRADSFEKPRSSSLAGRGGAPPFNRTVSAVSDLAMADAPAQTPPPRVFTATSLSEADLKTITELTTYLAENSYAYESHVQLIELLHRGLISHMHPPDGNAAAEPNPKDYNLLSELRQAREAMGSRFAVGEAIWKQWIQDECMLARTSEERSAIIELCQRAVQEEPASVELWLLYAEWMWSTYAAANGFAQTDPSSWTEEDKEICKEVFSRDLVLNVWEQAVEATKWRIDESHRLWDRWVELIMQDFPENPPTQAVEQLQSVYFTRVQIPHATSSSTSQAFWPVISKHNSDSWEEIMAAMNEMAGPARQQYALREEHELTVKRAVEANDKVALYTAFSDYLRWEKKHRRRSPFDDDLRSALYERALLSFPTTIDLWLDYVEFLLEKDPKNSLVLAILERGTRHCPWSGELWSRRMLRAEVQNVGYEDIEQIKHKATNSGLLDIGGMEEMIKVYTAWCSYLRRRAFHPDMTEDELDMAEMGILGTIEDVKVAGRKLYGPDFPGDPLYRTESIYIRFLSMSHRYADARGEWEKVAQGAAKDRLDFWEDYYRWELFFWGYGRMAEKNRVDTPNNGPTLATAVLKQALAQKNLDWPEKLLELYASHFQKHESSQGWEQAQIDVRKASLQLQQRRAREAEAAAAAAPAQQQYAPVAVPAEDASGKRKRDEEATQEGDAAKRSKRAEPDSQPPYNEVSSSASAQIKRDREHNTITVKNLAPDVSEKRLKQFFGDCGKIMSVGIIRNSETSTSTATIEFESAEDVTSARIRDGKEVDGHTISIQSGTLSTLYVTNYPPDFDEVKIRELFKDYGTIVSVRFPSLKYNQRRRFCYVQFLTSAESHAASTALNDKAIDGSHRLVALISDPEAKRNRQGATAEGRELHVGNVDFNASDAEVKAFFSDYGVVENVRTIKGANGRPTGTAFVVMKTKQEAEAAVAANGKPLRSRLLRVNLAQDKATKEKVTKIVNAAGEGGSGSPAADDASPADGGSGNGRRASIASNVSASHHDGSGDASSDTYKTKFERTVTLLNLPDTVNDARVQSFMEQFGPLRKVTVRRDKEGAIVEFVNLADAGKVGLGVDCTVLGPETRVGDYRQLMHRKKKDAGAKAGVGEKEREGEGAEKKGLPMARPVQRPAQRGARRGGLGFKRGGFGGGAGRADGGEAEMGARKSNADFRALFVKSGEKVEEKDGDDKEMKDGDGAV